VEGIPEALVGGKPLADQLAEMRAATGGSATPATPGTPATPA
jgi:hypothetical protein